MLDVAAKQVVQGVVSELTSKDKMFSAWDVTRIARARGAKNTFHGDVRNEIRDLFSNNEMVDTNGDNYTRQLKNIQPNIDTLVYFPISEDVENYDPTALDPAKIVAVQNVGNAAGVSDGSDDDDDDDDDTATNAVATSGSEITLDTQGDGFIRIPAAFMRSIGVEAGDEVVVLTTVNGLEIVSPNKAHSGHGITRSQSQKTDARNNLRIYRTTLHDAGIKKSRITIKVIGNDLVINK